MAGDGRRRRLPLSLRRNAVAWERQRPTWRDAKPALIAGALKRAQARPSGNWYVVGSSRDVGGGRRRGAAGAGGRAGGVGRPARRGGRRAGRWAGEWAAARAR
ncbi:2Fe-2S ferredoxin, partial [Streptomyces griseoincarnatus]